MTEELQRLLETGREQGVYTHASLCVVRDGEVLAHHLTSPAASRVFDVASVTKVFTAVAVLREFELEQRVSWLAGSPGVGELLSHSSGLPAWRPLFAHAARALGTTPAAMAASGGVGRSERIYRAVLAETPCDAVRPTYSDLGFIALWLELPREARWTDRGPHGAVPTGRGRPRTGNPEIESDLADSVGRSPLAIDGGADDDNAACVPDVCGHAGIFTDANTLAFFGDKIRRDAEDGSGGLLPRNKAELMFTRVAGSRTYGLDTPSGDNPSIGSILGRGPKGAAGHLGFTGCSLWIDRDAKLSIAFLTNAVLLERPSTKIKLFRPIVHDAVARALGLG